MSHSLTEYLVYYIFFFCHLYTFWLLLELLPYISCLSHISQSQGYIVLNRPWAFVQWLQQADIKEEYETHDNLNLVYDEFIYLFIFG